MVTNMIIDLIKEKYGENTKMLEPMVCDDANIPDCLRSILQQSNGIQETMLHPKTGEQIVIGWIVYSYEEMIKSTNLYKEEYCLSGVVFCDDGAGNPFYLLDGKVYEFDPIDNESSLVAGSIEEFFE